MLRIDRASTSQNIIVTLTENVTITNPYFLFRFINVSTQALVAYFDNQDLSTSHERFNEFNINPSILFAGKDSGQWMYEIYEAVDTSTRDGLNLLENGRMVLTGTELTITGHEPTTTFTGYAG